MPTPPPLITDLGDNPTRRGSRRGVPGKIWMEERGDGIGGRVGCGVGSCEDGKGEPEDEERDCLHGVERDGSRHGARIAPWRRLWVYGVLEEWGVYNHVNRTIQSAIPSHSSLLCFRESDPVQHAGGLFQSVFQHAAVQVNHHSDLRPAPAAPRQAWRPTSRSTTAPAPHPPPSRRQPPTYHQHARSTRSTRSTFATNAMPSAANAVSSSRSRATTVPTVSLKYRMPALEPNGIGKHTSRRESSC